MGDVQGILGLMEVHSGCAEVVEAGLGVLAALSRVDGALWRQPGVKRVARLVAGRHMGHEGIQGYWGLLQG